MNRFNNSQEKLMYSIFPFFRRSLNFEFHSQKQIAYNRKAVLAFNKINFFI